MLPEYIRLVFPAYTRGGSLFDKSVSFVAWICDRRWLAAGSDCDALQLTDHFHRCAVSGISQIEAVRHVQELKAKRHARQEQLYLSLTVQEIASIQNQPPPLSPSRKRKLDQASASRADSRCAYCKKELKGSGHTRKGDFRVDVPFQCPTLAVDVENGTVDYKRLERARDRKKVRAFVTGRVNESIDSSGDSQGQVIY